MTRELEITDGDASDYAALAHLHYRARPPAVIERVLTARWRASSKAPLIGVLVVARPTLNASWRERAWPEIFCSGTTARERAARCAAMVRAIARLIVVPRARGLGVGRALVQRAVQQRTTPCLEAVAAMGWSSPVFARAGMRPVNEVEPAHVARLRARLTALGIARSDLALMACPTRFMARLRTRRAGDSVATEVARALAVWADASSATRSEKNAGPITLLPQAAQALLGRRVFVV